MRQGVPHMVTASSIEHSTNESDFFKSPQPSEARELSMSPPPGGRGELNTYGPSQQGNTREDKDDDPVKVKLLRCGVALHRTKDGYAGRANTIGGYFELNRQVTAFDLCLFFDEPAHQSIILVLRLCQERQRRTLALSLPISPRHTVSELKYLPTPR